MVLLFTASNVAKASTDFAWETLDLRVQLRDCGTGSGSARLQGGRLQLQLPPDQLLAGWSQERGVDLVFALPGESGLAHDSAPARHAVDPWLLRSDRHGIVEFDLRALGHSSPAELSWQLHCLPREQDDHTRRWKRLHAFSHRVEGWPLIREKSDVFL